MKLNRAFRRVLFSVLCGISGWASGFGDGNAQTFGADVGTIYLSGSETFYQDNLVVGSFTSFDFYIVAEIDYADIGAGDQNLTNGISAWEMGAQMPAEIIITKAETNPINALNLGTNTNWLIGLGTTFTASTSPMRLVTYTGLITDPVTPENVYLPARGADPSTFTPAVPGFIDGEVSGECFLPDSTPAKCKRKFSVAKGMYINRTIPVETPSWSDVKSRFGG